MRALLLALLILPAFPRAARADDDEEDVKIQRYLVSLQLGDNIEEVRRVYPPASEWPVVENKNGVTRYRVEKSMAKIFPPHVETLFVGFKKGRLVEIQTVFDEKKSRAQPVNKLAGEYALVYGEGHLSGNRFWWSDGRTVLRVFHSDVPLAGDGADAVAWRTAVQVFDQSLAGSGD
ncbi:MAG: hypothetical protein KGL74_13425 [Elusimicrobia bacterium]|nr:hypothetical protein [Elusimicrobiota bacterium]